MRGPLLTTIAWRFLRGRRTRLLDGAARSALVATAIGVAALVVAMALMSGYRDALETKLTQDRVAVMVYPLTPEAFSLEPEARQSIVAMTGVTGLRRVAYGQGSLRSASRPGGTDVTLRGVDELEPIEGLGSVDYFDRPQRKQGTSGPSPVILGRELFQALGADRDEALRLLVLGVREGRPRFAYRTVEIAGVFSSGLSEYDRRLAIMERQVLESLTGAAVGETIFEVLVADARKSSSVAERVREILGADYLIMDWPDLNRELFTALEVQKLALFLLLGLIVVVSTFNVASTLLVLVRERTRDVGVLAAVGFSPKELRRLFLLYGSGLSIAGVAVGAALGSVTAWILTRYEVIRFDPELAEIYFLSSVPLDVRAPDVAAIIGFTVLVTVLACWLPARKLSGIQPATALRAE
jgi:lipoprotein-releasing system permease protein